MKRSRYASYDSAKPARSERILIVDDEPWITDVISEQLSMEGFRTQKTNDSSKVMDMLSRDQYDLVITDIHMPEPDGLALLRQIQKKDPFLPILMLTAFTDAETATQAMKEGASDYLVKPHNTTQLSLRVERALERSQLLREKALAHRLLEQRVQEQTQKLRQQSQQLANMLERVIVTYRATLRALEATLDVRDQSAPGHCQRVAKLAVRLAKKMGYSGRDLVALEHGARLHDIGKLGISDTLLMKPGPLTNAERRTMQKHPEIGCQIVGHIDFLKNALPIIRYHHERYDGAGYPDGLRGEEIPMLARIFTIVDVFDAQTNRRPYNTVRSVQSTLESMRANAGKLLDPEVVNAFTAMIEEPDLDKESEDFVGALHDAAPKTTREA